MADSPSICFAVLQAMITDTGKDHDFLSAQMKWKKPWKKVLYEDQGVPDNYVDGSFLEEMKKNCEYCRRAFWQDFYRHDLYADTANLSYLAFIWYKIHFLVLDIHTYRLYLFQKQTV